MYIPVFNNNLHLFSDNCFFSNCFVKPFSDLTFSLLLKMDIFCEKIKNRLPSTVFVEMLDISFVN